jgi:four helix bundle protein
MLVRNFEELIVWQDARKLANLVHSAFLELKDFCFRDQINDAAVSVMNNTAEGFERFSNAEFKRFLQIAKASNGEVRSMSYLAEDFKYISEDKAFEIRNLCKKIKSEIINLMNSLKVPPKRKKSAIE